MTGDQQDGNASTDHAPPPQFPRWSPPWRPVRCSWRSVIGYPARRRGEAEPVPGAGRTWAFIRWAVRKWFPSADCTALRACLCGT